MAALTKNSERRQRPGDRGRVELAANVKVYQGSLLEVDADGRAKAAAAGANKKYIGFAVQEGDNTGGAAGDVVVEYVRAGAFHLSAATSGANKVDIGDDVYAADDDSVDLTSNARTKLGKVIDKDDDGVWVVLA